MFRSKSLLCAILSSSLAHAQQPIALDEVVVQAEAEAEARVQEPYLPDVMGTRILSGKKQSVIDLDALPNVVNNNYRQALTRTPGLYLSEESTPLVSLGYRGLDPHRVQFTQVLKDGIPIHADQFGYPEAYYTPPLDTVDRIEFFRGGSALMYGPQPGGALNFITHRPRTDRPFSFGSKFTLGSDDLFSNFSYFDGTVGRVGFYGYYNHREGDGFRDANSEFRLDAFHVKLVLDGTTDSRWILTLEGYDEDHGEPGGLTFAEGPNAVNYNKNRNAASRLHDQFELERYSASLAWERDFSDATHLTITGWSTYYVRYSSRQNGGGFGLLPSGPAAETTNVENQEFTTLGLDARLRHDYAWLGGNHTISGGFQVYYTKSPRQDRKGDTDQARGGDLIKDTDRSAFYTPVFVENRFAWGPLSITPGVRLENIWQSVRENKNLDKQAVGTPLGEEDSYEFVPLFGLGVGLEVARDQTIYANVSQSYRPKIYTQAVPNSATTLVPNDLDAASAWQYEIGYRGRPAPWVFWDVSGFVLDFDDQVGTVALPGGFSTVANVGRARHIGLEAAAELDVIGLLDYCNGNRPAADGKSPAPPTLAERFGSLSLHGNVMVLDAEFVSGPLDGNIPRFAPDYLIRAGLIYRLGDRFKLSLLGTFVDSSFGDDGNSPERFVPAYMVWDLTAEVAVYRDIVSVHAGVNNLFGEDYYSRVRDDGIDPAYGRNYYVGVSFKF
jgi:Fe(3+) dicitrate transport protein